MNYKELTSENTTFDVNFIRFLRFHKSQYMKNVLLEDDISSKNKKLENSIFSIKEPSDHVSLTSRISDFLFS